MKWRVWIQTVVAVAMAGACTYPALADTPGEHPHYLHALSDLRFARALLNHQDEFNVMVDQRSSVEMINHAIGEIKRASIDDGKNLDSHPSIDVHLQRVGRIRKSLELMQAALRDLKYEEDDRAALKWRARAIQDVRDAIGFAQKAVRDDRADERREGH